MDGRSGPITKLPNCSPLHPASTLPPSAPEISSGCKKKKKKEEGRKEKEKPAKRRTKKRKNKRWKAGSDRGLSHHHALAGWQGYGVGLLLLGLQCDLPGWEAFPHVGRTTNATDKLP